jgi:hypothetical protein
VDVSDIKLVRLSDTLNSLDSLKSSASPTPPQSLVPDKLANTMGSFANKNGEIGSLSQPSLDTNNPDRAHVIYSRSKRRQ